MATILLNILLCLHETKQLGSFSEQLWKRKKGKTDAMQKNVIFVLKFNTYGYSYNGSYKLIRYQEKSLPDKER